MASVPYNPLPNVAPASIGAAPQIRVKANAQDFGANIGQATQGLGQSLQHIGDVAAHYAIQEQLEKNDVELTNAQTQMNEKFSEVNSWYRSLEGMAAVDAEKEAVARFKQARQDVRATLSNDAVKRAYDRATTPTEGFAIRDTGIYKAGQQKVAVHNASNASIEQSKNQAATPGLPEDLFGTALGNIDIQIEKQMITQGWGSEMARLDDGTMIFADTERGKQAEAIYKAQLDNHVGPAWENRIRTMATDPVNGNPIKAMEYLQANKDHIPPDVFAKLTASLAAPYRDEQVRSVADELQAIENQEYKDYVAKHGMVNRADWDIQHMESNIARARKRAEELHPGDARFSDALEARDMTQANLRTSMADRVEQRQLMRYNQEQARHNRQIKLDSQAVYKWMFHSGPGGGQVTDYQSDILNAPPAIRAAYDRLVEADPAKFDSFIKHMEVEKSKGYTDGFGTAFWQAQQQIFSGKVTNIADLEPMMRKELRKNSPLTLPALQALDQQLRMFEGPQGQAFKEEFQSFIEKARNDIIGIKHGIEASDVEDPKFTQFMQSVMPRIMVGKQKGLTGAQMFDPDSPDYVGTGISNFQTDLASQMRASTRSMNDSLKKDNFIGNQFSKEVFDKITDDKVGISTLQDGVKQGILTPQEARKYAVQRGWAKERYVVPAGGMK